jgi:hypothetical protein
MNARTEAIDAVRNLCARLGKRIAQNSGGVFDADLAASDMIAGAIQCYDKLDPREFRDESQIARAVANAVHRDYQDMMRKATSFAQDDSLSVAVNMDRQARSSLCVTGDASGVVAPSQDVALHVDMEAMLASMDGLNEEICRRLMDGECPTKIARELKLTHASLNRRIASIKTLLKPLQENQDTKGSE